MSDLPPAIQGFTPPQQPSQSFGGSSTDKVLTIVLIVLGPVACLIGSFWDAFSVMATDSCGSDCGAGADWGIWLMLIAPWLVWLAASVWAIVRLVRRKVAFWVMLGAGVVAVVIYVLANILLAVAIS